MTHLRMLVPVLVLALTMGAAVGRCAERRVLDLGGGVTLELAVVPAGSFQMGSPTTEEGRRDFEGPVHTVTIVRPFALGVTEVTHAQWHAVMGGSMRCLEESEQPIANVTWNEAREYCERLSAMQGAVVHLPSEAQWEYACRAGSTGPRYGELDDVAWYEANSGGASMAVATKRANAWGFHDMLGNVWEFCEDAWQPSYEGAPTDGSAVTGTGNRVFRGGAWDYPPDGCRAASRRHAAADFHSDRIGFRVMMDLEGEE